MQTAQTTFISSTFWTDKIGSADLKTLEMERICSMSRLPDRNEISAKWKLLAKKYEHQINVFRLPAMAGFSF